MKRRTLRVVTIASCFAALTLLAAVPQARAQSGSRDRASIRARKADSSKPRVSAQPMLLASDHSVVPGGGSVLVRTKDGVYMSVQAFGLPVGNAVTAWFAIFNDPSKCATHPCTVADLSNADAQPSLVNATGRVIGSDGTANFGAYCAIGDTTGAFLGPGLLSPFKAEIHLVVRSHGPANLDNPQVFLEQLTMFNGGCPPNTCGNLQVSIHQP